MKSIQLSNKNKTFLLVISLLVAIATGWRMFSLYEQKELWGHLPLFFFISIWASVVFIFWKKYTRHPKGLRWLALSTLSGILLSLGFPPLPLTFLLFIAWVPILVVENEISKEKESPNASPSLFPYVYNTFVLWNVLVTWWVGNTAFLAGLFAFFLNALFMVVPFLLFHKTKKVLPNLAYTAFAAYWISFEMLHLHWELSWSWLNLGNAFGQFPSWVQWYEYTGTFGGTLWILVANILILNILINSKFVISLKKLWKENIGGVIKLAVVILVPILVSLVMYAQHEDIGREVEVVVVQPNFEPHYEKFKIPKDEQIDRFLRLSEKAITPETKYLVFPETSFNAGEKSSVGVNKYVRRLNGFLAQHPDLKLVTGVNAYKVFKAGEPHTNSTKEDVRSDGSPVFWEAYNAAIQLPHQDSVQFYVKGKLVPGAEITPYHKALFFLEPIVDQLGGSLEGHGTSQKRQAFSSNSGKIAPVICYESVFGDYHAGYIREGAEAIFIVTNDGWWDKTPGHKQHLKFASLRAIETRRSVARSANVGTTCFINQRGEVLQPTKYGIEEAVNGKVRFNNEITFYVKWGDLIGRLGVFLAAILILNTIAKSRKMRIEN